MAADKLPEPWLRGPLVGVDPLVAPLVYSFQQAREDLALWTEGLTAEQVWAQRHGLAPVGFHLRHIAGSVERLMTYALGGELSAVQLEAMKQEAERGGSPGELLAQVDATLARAEQQARALDPATLPDSRSVGRKLLPTTVHGLLWHIAEHTQRHVGQAIFAAKLVKNLSTEQS